MKSLQKIYVVNVKKEGDNTDLNEYFSSYESAKKNAISWFKFFNQEIEDSYEVGEDFTSVFIGGDVYVQVSSEYVKN